MIRDMGGRIVRYSDPRVQAKWARSRMQGRVRATRERAPRTEILCCVVCRHAYPLRAHDPLACARQRDIDGGELYVLEHRFYRECGRSV